MCKGENGWRNARRMKEIEGMEKCMCEGAGWAKPSASGREMEWRKGVATMGTAKI